MERLLRSSPGGTGPAFSTSIVLVLKCRVRVTRYTQLLSRVACSHPHADSPTARLLRYITVILPDARLRSESEVENMRLVTP